MSIQSKNITGHIFYAKVHNLCFDRNWKEFFSDYKYGTFNKLAKTGTSKYKKEQMLKVT